MPVPHYGELRIGREDPRAVLPRADRVLRSQRTIVDADASLIPRSIAQALSWVDIPAVGESQVRTAAASRDLLHCRRVTCAIAGTQSTRRDPCRLSSFWSGSEDHALKLPEFELLDAIASGELDHHLVVIADAVHARRELLHAVRSATAIAQLCVGDNVMFNGNVRPRYLEHELAVITELTRSACGSSECARRW